MSVGVFPLDVWRVILHFALNKHYHAHYSGDCVYQSQKTGGFRGFMFHLRFDMSQGLHALSLIHPRVRSLLHAVTIRQSRTLFNIRPLIKE